MNFGQGACALGIGMTFIVAFAQAMADPLQESITAVAELKWDHISILGPLGHLSPIFIVVGIALATTQTWIVLGMPGARGDPVQEHVVGAIGHVREPKMADLMADKNAQDRQHPPQYATQTIAQVRKNLISFDKKLY